MVCCKAMVCLPRTENGHENTIRTTKRQSNHVDSQTFLAASLFGRSDDMFASDIFANLSETLFSTCVRPTAQSDREESKR